MGFPDLNEVISAISSDAIQSSGLAEQAPAPVTEAPAPAPEAPAPAHAPTPEEKALDLAELVQGKKFKFGDSEYTLTDLDKKIKELERSGMRWKDYTQKTQEFSAIKKEHEQLKSERPFWDSFHTDLEKVKANPALLSEFKQVYPESFHKYVAEIESQQPLTRESVREMIRQTVDPAVKPFQDRFTEEEAKSQVAKFESWDSSFKTQYKEADIQHVYTLLENAKTNGIPMNKETWEQAWKISHDTFDAKIKQAASASIQTQKTLNQAGKDSRSGGTIPGQAPQKLAFRDSGKALEDYLASLPQN